MRDPLPLRPRRGRHPMSDKKQPEIKIPNTKTEDEKDGNVMIAMRLVQQPVLPQDVYSVNEVAKLLGMDKKRVYNYSRMPRNPLPLRKWPNGGRGAIVLRDELIEWLRDYTVLPEEYYPSHEK